jgi:uncharacterized sulfatase
VTVCSACSTKQPPNIVLIFADDLGYGDVGVYGATLIDTPNIDVLAAEGARLTQFYASGNVCTPSRAGLLTGRYPIRAGLADRTLSIGDERGLMQREETLPEQLGLLGYTTALIGKWHLGDQPEYHPLEHGFDEFFGILYSNDEPEQSLLSGREIVEHPIDAQMLALDFTRESLRFIQRNHDRPFFLLMSMTSPHKPLIPSADFAGRSGAGAYGDVVEELDWGVGEVMDALEKYGLSDNTLVIFTSDNGPFPEGSTGDLRGGKGTGWEGGYRVPFIARWPAQIEQGTVSSAMSMNIDMMPTLLNIAGGQNAVGHELDGKDISSALHGSDHSPHEVLYFFNNERIAALRTQRWRLMLSDYPPWRDAQPIRFEGKQNLYTLLYDMEIEPGQQYDLSRDYPVEKQQMESLLHLGRESLESLSKLPDSTQFGDNYKN